ncbi:MAG: hypothetical protein P0Y62_02565 [Candidatus Chryseobacterium colombiense]|nr:hypothetical protein [Chryseobacterium sp.]WEK70438.1 MAG: hypothetical protein P0Y62_02565 [Chryseobacterium sp.]
MIKIKRKFHYLIGRTKADIISDFGENYVESENIFYYTINRTWFTKGITLSVRFDQDDKVKAVSTMKNNYTLIWHSVFDR